MTDKPPTLALRSLTPDLVQQWMRRDEASLKMFNDGLDRLSRKFNSNTLMIRSAYDGIWVRGYEERDPRKAPPLGWRREGGSSAVVPHLRSRAGKEAKAMLDSFSHKREELPGLPSLVWGDGYMGTWTLAEHSGEWFATITVPLGQRSYEQTRLCDINQHMWETVPLSVYWAAVEKESAHV